MCKTDLELFCAKQTLYSYFVQNRRCRDAMCKTDVTIDQLNITCKTEITTETYQTLILRKQIKLRNLSNTVQHYLPFEGN